MTIPVSSRQARLFFSASCTVYKSEGHRHVHYKVLAMSLFTYRFAPASLLATSSEAVECEGDSAPLGEGEAFDIVIEFT